MAYLITFATDTFDISKEEPNAINPIAGQGLLKWIRGKLEGSGYTTTEPATEDWGWYIDVEGKGSSYLVGASGQPERPAPDMDWIIQIDKNRSLKDKVTGRNKMTGDDPLVALLESLVRNEPSFREINVERDA
ncbi:MAG: hypothetical protein HYX75_20675 [Acidobacteria bacterium]|nr:hypothetical protein [Acidobacteriota bacterium]